MDVTNSYARNSFGGPRALVPPPAEAILSCLGSETI